MSRELKIALFLGAGASVPFGKPTTQQLKNQLLNKYKKLTASGSDFYYVHSIINYSKFQDIEHVLQCIKEIDDFFTMSEYGGSYLLAHKLTFQHDPTRPWELDSLTGRIGNIRKIVEDDVFESYAWDHSSDHVLGQIIDRLLGLIRSHSKEIHVFTTNYDRAVEEYCSKKERNCRCIDGFQLDEYSNRRL
jgi:hypothetical protein